jgi:hypothetical protein
MDLPDMHCTLTPTFPRWTNLSLLTRFEMDNPGGVTDLTSTLEGDLVSPLTATASWVSGVEADCMHPEPG